ncbi:hypothetical protein [Streptomyces sp. H27-D2]|uniref:hypothetical protein n=1 Tax=Streptomyces sp. H27-D2 TaxID=3046304 RepID=UPI002DB5DA73|nr:hypothetical protein [Streptomyces sp. H27-D2]MEC4020450.1 hypothetical protein [Streptomyces sp. H27-D2]
MVDLITTRLTAAADQPLPPDAVRALVHQAVTDARHLPTTAAQRALPATTDPHITEMRRQVDRLEALAGDIGRLMLEIAPAYLTDSQAARRLGIFAAEIGLTLEEALADRRYAISGDRRALVGIVL